MASCGIRRILISEYFGKIKSPMPVTNLELLQQVHLSGEAKCATFSPNSWRPSFCTNCSSLFDKHSPEAIPNDEVLIKVCDQHPAHVLGHCLGVVCRSHRQSSTRRKVSRQLAVSCLLSRTVEVSSWADSRVSSMHNSCTTPTLDTLSTLLRDWKSLAPNIQLSVLPCEL